MSTDGQADEEGRQSDEELQNAVAQAARILIQAAAPGLPVKVIVEFQKVLARTDRLVAQRLGIRKSTAGKTTKRKTKGSRKKKGGRKKKGSRKSSKKMAG